MAKDINDITAAFETRHNRAVMVAQYMALAVSQSAYIIAAVEQQVPEYRIIRENLLDGLRDVAELIDGFTSDVEDVCQYHIVVMREMERERMNTKRQVLRKGLYTVLRFIGWLSLGLVALFFAELIAIFIFQHFISGDVVIFGRMI